MRKLGWSSIKNIGRTANRPAGDPQWSSVHIARQCLDDADDRPGTDDSQQREEKEFGDKVLPCLSLPEAVAKLTECPESRCSFHIMDITLCDASPDVT